jgi:hypothetical protein
MDNLIRKLPRTTLISVGHRPELESYHDRKITLERRRGSTRLVSDQSCGQIPLKGRPLELVSGENAITAGAKLPERASGRRALLRNWLSSPRKSTGRLDTGNSKEFQVIDRIARCCVSSRVH